MSGVTNGIEMRHICQALQMDLKCLTYMSGVTNGIEMRQYVRHYNSMVTPEYETHIQTLQMERLNIDNIQTSQM